MSQIWTSIAWISIIFMIVRILSLLLFPVGSFPLSFPLLELRMVALNASVLLFDQSARLFCLKESPQGVRHVGLPPSLSFAEEYRDTAP